MVRLATRTWDDVAGPGGRRPLAVLVHGVTSSSRTWWRVAPALAERGFEVLSVDLRGHGASPRVSEGLGLPDLADDLAETVQAGAQAFPAEVPGMGQIPPIDLLVGHSLGALVVSQALATWPGLGARARDDPDGLRWDLLAESPASPPGEAERRVADLTDCDATGIAAALRRQVTYDLPGLLALVQVPALLLIGEETLGSALVGPDRTALVDALGQGTVEVLRAGHNLHREAFDAFMVAIDRWLAHAARLD